MKAENAKNVMADCSHHASVRVVSPNRLAMGSDEEAGTSANDIR